MTPLKWCRLKRPGALAPVFFLSICATNLAQYLPPGVESAGLSGCYANLDGPTAIAGNQAGLGWNGNGKVILETDYMMPFLVKELGIAGISITLPVNHGCLGGKLASKGIPGYRDHAVWLSYGMQMNNKFSAGLGLFYNLVSVKGTPEHLFRSSFASGIQVKLNDQIMLGGHVMFPFQYNTSDQLHNRLLSGITLGGSYEFFEKNILYAECRFTEKQDLAFSTGISSVIGKLITIRGGFQTKPSSFSFGAGFRIYKITITTSSQLIFQYGTSSSIGIAYAL